MESRLGIYSKIVAVIFLIGVQAAPSISACPAGSGTHRALCGHSLPARLILLLDGVSYRDVEALQQGVALSRNGKVHLQAFREGYHPASRLISTFPSISDPAWEEILGNPPPPGYQRTYFDATKDSEVYL